MLAVISIFAAGLACSSETPVNENAKPASNVNAPPEFSASPIPMSSLPPGIPDPNSNVNMLPKGTTPTPGIPSEKELGKPLKKGATPIPGIPDSVIRNNSINESNVNSKAGKDTPQIKAYPANSVVNKP